MKFAILGSGAVGGYYGAKLARAGHDVTLLARGDHLHAIRERGLAIKSPLGDFIVKAPAESDPARVGVVDVVIVAVKTYSNPHALPMLKRLVGEATAVLTLQNGIDSVEEVAAVAGDAHVLGGATYIATALAGPGVIEQTGTHRRIVFGEVFGDCARISDRVRRISDAMVGADIQGEAVADARPPIWEKFCYLSPFAGFTGAARLPIGHLWRNPQAREALLSACEEVERVGRAEGVRLAAGLRDRITKYLDAIPGATRSSLLIDLQQGKPIEVEALQGSVVRRGLAKGVPTPYLAALYAVLKPYEHGPATT